MKFDIGLFIRTSCVGVYHWHHVYVKSHHTSAFFTSFAWLFEYYTFPNITKREHVSFTLYISNESIPCLVLPIFYFHIRNASILAIQSRFWHLDWQKATDLFYCIHFLIGLIQLLLDETLSNTIISLYSGIDCPQPKHVYFKRNSLKCNKRLIVSENILAHSHCNLLVR